MSGKDCMDKDSLTVEVLPSDEGRVSSLQDCFQAKFGQRAELVVRVPGRVNLIGEHIDYCGYAVHPMAIEQDIIVAVCKRSKPGLSLANVDQRYCDWEEADLSHISITPGCPSWWGYFLCGLKGVAEMQLGPVENLGLCCMVQGTIPPSAGLSSSSALVVSAALSLLWAQHKLVIGREKLATVCASAERFIGTQGGGMDQAIELLAVKGAAKLIEFGPLRSFDVKLPSGAVFVVANSLEEKNKAASNDYNTRVVECRLATMVLAKKLLGDGEWREAGRLKEVQQKVGVEVIKMVEKVESVLHQEDYSRKEVLEILGEDEAWLQSKVLTPNTQSLETFRLYQRAKHVYSEAARVYQFRDVCETGGSSALTSLGSMMTASHVSCRDLYQCSSSGLDKLVELATTSGALGARLTGAGWGGCIVALVREGEEHSLWRD